MPNLAGRLDQGFAGLSSASASIAAAIIRGALAYPPVGETAQLSRLDRLVAAGAWTEAALALAALELPDWHLRRLERDGADWWCTLSLYPRAPRGYDAAVDGRDRLPALAILDALREARERRPPPEYGSRRAVGRADCGGEAMWCDNVF